VNDRIHRLRQEADVWCDQNHFGDEFYEVRWEEKFAELLIRECINIAYEYDKPKLSGPGLAIASNIESHFDIYIEEDGRFVK
jgi:hypothetical protein